MSRTYKVLLAGLALSGVLQTAHAEDSEMPPGLEALEAFRHGRPRMNPVQNRFFLKGRRFEISPMVGTAPNNPFASRFNISLGFGYHFSEVLALAGMFSFAPDLGKNDVKPLAPILLQRATSDDFQQPLDKVTFSGALGVEWAPVYGKINILGEVIANFDFYGFLGLGMVVQQEYAAVKNPNYVDGAPTTEYFDLVKGPSEVRVAPTIGVGGHFFITQLVALRLDGRFLLYPDDKPQYDPNTPVEGMRLVTLFNASVGVSFFIPKMKPRLYDF